MNEGFREPAMNEWEAGAREPTKTNRSTMQQDSLMGDELAVAETSSVPCSKEAESGANEKEKDVDELRKDGGSGQFTTPQHKSEEEEITYAGGANVENFMGDCFEPGFVRFPLLPAEIRLQIWRETFPPPKKIFLYAHGFMEPERLEENGQNEWVPVSLLVNVESRTETLKSYKPLEILPDSLWYILTETKDTVIWLQNGYDSIWLEHWQLIIYYDTLITWMTYTESQIPTFLLSIQEVVINDIHFGQNLLTKTRWMSPLQRKIVEILQELLLRFKGLRKCSFIEVDEWSVAIDDRMKASGSCLKVESDIRQFFQSHDGSFSNGVPEPRLLQWEEHVQGECFEVNEHSGWTHHENFEHWRRFWIRDEEKLRILELRASEEEEEDSNDEDNSKEETSVD